MALLSSRVAADVTVAGSALPVPVGYDAHEPRCEAGDRAHYGYKVEEQGGLNQTDQHQEWQDSTCQEQNKGNHD